MLVEVIEVPDHPWFVGCQFHPEFTSAPREGHPLFTGFIKAAIAQHDMVGGSGKQHDAQANSLPQAAQGIAQA
jgi:hypothetical protein